MSWLAMRHAPARRSRSASGKGESNGRERSAKAAWFAVFKNIPSTNGNIVLYVRKTVKTGFVQFERYLTWTVS